MDRIDEELGTFIGKLTTAEAFKALQDHTPGEWVCELTAPNGERVWHRTGWSWYTAADDHRLMFAVGSNQERAGNPAMFANALVLAFGKNLPLSGECEQYDGGLVFTFAFGSYNGHTLKMLAWHGVMHETESGDVAPGLGPFKITDVKEIDEDEVSDDGQGQG